jgi:hypothetical protein
MADNSSLYGSTPPSGTVSSSNYTTLYSGNNNYVPSGDNVIISGTLTVNGCAILTDCSAFSLLPSNATTVNAFNSATAVSIGGDTGVTTIQNQLSTGNYLFPLADGNTNQVLASDGAGVLYWANPGSLSTTYTIDASTTTGGANFNLTDSDGGVDTIKFANGTGISVSRTNANTITITNTAPEDAYTLDASTTVGGANLNLSNSAATDSVAFKGSGATTVTRTSADIITVSSTDTNTTYTQNASSTTGGANLNLVGSDATTDSVKFASGTGITVTRTDANTITITNDDPGSAGVTSITGTTNQIIASASTGAVTLSTPQDIATTSSPTFNDLTLTNNLTLNNGQVGNAVVSAYGGTTLGTLTWDGTNWISSNGFSAGALRGGNVTIGYLDDQKINTLTGDLTITSATNLVGIPASLTVDSGVLYVDATNNRVGINNTAPDYELHIDQGLDGLTQLAMTTSERTAILTMNDGDDLLSLSYGLSPGGTNRLQFSPTDQWFNLGNLGVGTNTPDYTLDVAGDVKVGGDTIYNSYDEKLIEYSQAPSIYGTSRQASFQATNNIGVRASFFFIDGITELNTNSLTTSATTPDQVLSYFDQTSVEAVKSTIKVVSGGAVQCIEVLMVQDGTNISLNTYGDVRTAGNLTTVSSGYNATTGYWELRVTPVNAVTSYRVTNQIMN